MVSWTSCILHPVHGVDYSRGRAQPVLTHFCITPSLLTWLTLRFSLPLPPPQVAEAPKVRSNKVQDITELDEDMHFRLPSNEDRDIDLSLLTAVLCSSEQVRAERRGGVHVSDIQRALTKAGKGSQGLLFSEALPSSEQA